ncbi:MAG TPA: DUF2127 domain-containing protein [Candidatus Binatia bacterium]|nr:DUF2127 domain-containing protein [Candidatus Binatia bacterium]
MKLNETQLHLLFKIGVVIKGIDGALEAIAGVALCFTSTAALRDLVDWLTQGELQEDPDDFIANQLVNFFHNLSINTEHLAAVYLITYGVTKVGLVIGLLRGKLWAYPSALVILGLFLCYQIYRFSYNHSVGLAFVSLLDLAILVVIWRDYQYLKARHGQIARPNISS